MVGFMGMGMRGNKMPMKRKDPDFDMDGLHHDFSDFSLSSPARKIRILDAELPPIMEESELESESVNDFDMDGLHHDFSDFSLSSPARKIRRLDAELPPIMEESELESESVNDKAIVLFKPLTSPLSSSPSSISVDSDLISGFKDEFIRAITKQNRTTGIEISELPTEHSELTTDADDSMEIEDANENTLQSGPSGDGYGGMAGMWVGGEGLPQWQQQHCMVPQPPHNTFTPISWFL